MKRFNDESFDDGNYEEQEEDGLGFNLSQPSDAEKLSRARKRYLL
jgi:hypothetical protein